MKKIKLLWEGKIKFIEQQRDNLKKELLDSNKRFETMIETIQKKVILKKKNQKVPIKI